MCRTIRSTLVIFLLLISLVPGESKSSLIKTFLKFSAVDLSNDKSIQIPPSQSPNPSIGLDSGGGEYSGGERGENDEHDQVPSNSPTAELIAITDERCNISSTMSCRVSNKMTACLSNGTGPEGSYLVVQNDKDTPVNVNLTILPSNVTSRK